MWRLEFQKPLVIAGYTIVSVVPHQLLVQSVNCVGRLSMEVFPQPFLDVLLLGFQLLVAGGRYSFEGMQGLPGTL